MQLPLYFDDVPRLRVVDPLARVLGSARNGELEYGFGDAVRLTGHACPSVAVAYWLTFLALEYLYPDSLPKRGEIRVDFREDARSGTTGVMATVVQMLTGAAGSSGFRGIGGRFSRAGLIRRQPDLLMTMRFTRTDNRAAVDAGVDLSLVPQDLATTPLVAKIAAGTATPKEEQELGKLWQDRVRRLLLEYGRDPAVFMVHPLRQRASIHPVSRSAEPTANPSCKSPPRDHTKALTER